MTSALQKWEVGAMVKVYTIGKSFLALGVVSMIVGCGSKPSRMERALSEKDSIIRRQENDLANSMKREESHQAQLQAHQGQLQSQMQANQELLKHNETLAGNLDQVGKRTADEIVKSRQQVRSLSDQIAALEKKLGANKSEGVEIRQDEDGVITIRVANTVLFGLGKADLKSSSYAKLNQIVKTLRSQYPKNFIRVEGHTDSSPVRKHKHLFADNMVLSQARSKAVYDYMIKKAGMPANMMYTAGYSYYQPVVWPEKTKRDQARNRRVDIVILPNVKVSKKSLASNTR